MAKLGVVGLVTASCLIAIACGQEVPSTAETPLGVKSGAEVTLDGVAGCNLEPHNRLVASVLVGEDAYCLGARCWEQWEPFRAELTTYRQQFRYQELVLISETESDERIMRTKREIKRTGLRDVVVCEAFARIRQRRDGAYDYPRDPEGSDHFCEHEAVVRESENAERSQVERWCEFDAGERTGVYALFSSETGFPLATGTYRGGRKRFLWLSFDAEGEVERSQWFIDDEPSDQFP